MTTWADIREDVLRRDGERCTVGWLLGGACSDLLHVHHLIPREQGGPDEIENLITVCERHHPQVEAVRREVLRRRGQVWKRCPHRPGAHRYPGAREQCERRLNQALLNAA